MLRFTAAFTGALLLAFPALAEDCPTTLDELTPTAPLVCSCAGAEVQTLGDIWGTLVYTGDSDLCTAARHAGVLRDGQGGEVKFSRLPGCPDYTGSTRHGITSQDYGPFATSLMFNEATDPVQAAKCSSALPVEPATPPVEPPIGEPPAPPTLPPIDPLESSGTGWSGTVTYTSSYTHTIDNVDSKYDAKATWQISGSHIRAQGTLRTETFAKPEKGWARIITQGAGTWDYKDPYDGGWVFVNETGVASINIMGFDAPATQTIDGITERGERMHKVENRTISIPDYVAPIHVKNAPKSGTWTGTFTQPPPPNLPGGWRVTWSLSCSSNCITP